MRIRLLLVVVVSIVVPGQTAGAQPHPAPVRVQFTPVMKNYVSGITWTAMTQECDRIWRQEGVEIRWREDNPHAAPDVTLPLVFDERELERHDRSRDQDAFGITVFRGRTLRVLVSVSRVRYLVGLRRQLADSNDSMVLESAVGRVLGRVVAHELGHVLLLTTEHAAEGLMSASLTGRRLIASDPALLTLTAHERARLARLAARFTSPDGERRADASTTAQSALPGTR